MKNLSPIEIKDKPLDNTIACFQCQVCEYSSLVPKEGLKGNEYQTMPKHCNEFTKIRLEKNKL